MHWHQAELCDLQGEVMSLKCGWLHSEDGVRLTNYEAQGGISRRMRSKDPRTLRKSPWGLTGRALLISLILAVLIIFSGSSFANDFAAVALEDLGDVAVIEVVGDYDADEVSKIDAPRHAIAKEFYKTHGDDYDFIFVFSNLYLKSSAIPHSLWQSQLMTTRRSLRRA